MVLSKMQMEEKIIREDGKRMIPPHGENGIFYSEIIPLGFCLHLLPLFMRIWHNRIPCFRWENEASFPKKLDAKDLRRKKMGGRYHYAILSLSFFFKAVATAVRCFLSAPSA